MNLNKSTAQGFSLLELIVAIALFMIFSAGLAGTAIGSYMTSLENAKMVKTNAHFVESREALKSIRNNNWSDVVNGTHGLAISGGHWVFSGSSDESDGYTRRITIEDVLRDDAGNIVISGADADSDTKRITIQLTWNSASRQSKSLSVSSYLTNYVSPAVWPVPPPESPPVP